MLTCSVVTVRQQFVSSTNVQSNFLSVASFMVHIYPPSVHLHLRCISTFGASPPLVHLHLWCISTFGTSPPLVHLHLRCISTFGTSPPAVRHIRGDWGDWGDRGEWGEWGDWGDQGEWGDRGSGQWVSGNWVSPAFRKYMVCIV